MTETYYEELLIKDKKLLKNTLEQYTFIDCHFLNCTFEECKIIRCRFINCKFSACTIISLSAEYTEVKNAVFNRCNLIGVHWIHLRPAGKYAHPIEKIENCCIKYNTFIEMSLVKFDFSGSILQESIFEQCNLMESHFENCRLDGTQFYKCDLRKADFRNAIGYGIDISSNKIQQALFSYPEVIRLLDSLEIKID